MTIFTNPWLFERVALYTFYSSRESAQLPNSFILNLSRSKFKTQYIVQIMKYNLQIKTSLCHSQLWQRLIKTIEYEEDIWGAWIWPEMFSPFPGLGHKYKWFWDSITALYWPLTWRKYIFSYFAWSHNKIPEIILKYKILVFKENIIIAMMFSFCWFVTWIFQILNRNYPFRNFRNSFSTSTCKWSFPKCTCRTL